MSPPSFSRMMKMSCAELSAETVKIARKSAYEQGRRDAMKEVIMSLRIILSHSDKIECARRDYNRHIWCVETWEIKELIEELLEEKK